MHISEENGIDPLSCFCFIKIAPVIAVLFLFLVHIYLVKLFVIFICKKCYINEVYLRKGLQSEAKPLCIVFK